MCCIIDLGELHGCYWSSICTGSYNLPYPMYFYWSWSEILCAQYTICYLRSANGTHEKKPPSYSKSYHCMDKCKPTMQQVSNVSKVKIVNNVNDDHKCGDV